MLLSRQRVGALRAPWTSSPEGGGARIRAHGNKGCLPAHIEKHGPVKLLRRCSPQGGGGCMGREGVGGGGVAPLACPRLATSWAPPPPRKVLEGAAQGAEGVRLGVGHSLRGLCRGGGGDPAVRCALAPGDAVCCVAVSSMSRWTHGARRTHCRAGWSSSAGGSGLGVKIECRGFKSCLTCDI